MTTNSSALRINPNDDRSVIGPDGMTRVAWFAERAEAARYVANQGVPAPGAGDAILLQRAEAAEAALAQARADLEHLQAEVAAAKVRKVIGKSQQRGGQVEVGERPAAPSPAPGANRP